MVRSKKLGDQAIDIGILVFLLVTALLCIAPIINTIAISFSDQAAAAAGQVYLWPVDFSLYSYEKLVGDSQFVRAFLISIERVVLGGGLNMLFAISMAYPLSKEIRVFRARNIYMWLIVFTMLFNGGIIPWYMTIRQLGILDTIWALVLPGAVQVFNVILLMNFFRGVPKELEEAAFIDGAGPWYTMLKIYLPVSLPALATIGLFTVVNHWNSFFDGLVLMNNPHNYPLQTYIQQLVVVVDVKNITDIEKLKEMMKISSRTMNSAKIMVSMVPILLLYPFLQRFFVKGIVLGSVKE